MKPFFSAPRFAVVSTTIVSMLALGVSQMSYAQSSPNSRPYDCAYPPDHRATDRIARQHYTKTGEQLTGMPTFQCRMEDGTIAEQTLTYSLNSDGEVEGTFKNYVPRSTSDYLVGGAIGVAAAAATIGVVFLVRRSMRGGARQESRMGGVGGAAMAAARVEIPKTVDARAMGVPGATGPTTVWGAAPAAPRGAAVFTQPGTNQTYYVNNNNGLLEMVLINQMLQNSVPHVAGTVLVENPAYLVDRGTVVQSPAIVDQAPSFADHVYGSPEPTVIDSTPVPFGGEGVLRSETTYDAGKPDAALDTSARDSWTPPDPGKTDAWTPAADKQDFMTQAPADASTDGGYKADPAPAQDSWTPSPQADPAPSYTPDPPSYDPGPSSTPDNN